MLIICKMFSPLFPCTKTLSYTQPQILSKKSISSITSILFNEILWEILVKKESMKDVLLGMRQRWQHQPWNISRQDISRTNESF